MNIPYLMKKCTVCGEWLVANTVNFYRAKKGRYGLASQCKKCRNKKNERWRLENKDKIAKQRKQRYEANREKELEHQKQYNKANRDKILEYKKQYYEANRKKELERVKQWHKANPEYYKQYYQSPQGQIAKFNSHNKRRLKEEQQGDGITKDQWLELMSFFGWRCAYSGEYLGGNDNSFNRTIDHIVPLNSGGDNMIWNCVPMLRSLNSSKSTKDMEEWYREQSFYDPKRLQKIYEWQEYAYNKYGKNTQYFNTNDIQIKLL